MGQDGTDLGRQDEELGNFYIGNCAKCGQPVTAAEDGFSLGYILGVYEDPMAGPQALLAAMGLTEGLPERKVWHLHATADCPGDEDLVAILEDEDHEKNELYRLALRALRSSAVEHDARLQYMKYRHETGQCGCAPEPQTRSVEADNEGWADLGGI